MAKKKKTTKTEEPETEEKKVEEKPTEEKAAPKADRKTELSQELAALQKERDEARASGSYRLKEILKRINEINAELAG